jgi:ribosomal protein L11 methyltransferase
VWQTTRFNLFGFFMSEQWWEISVVGDATIEDLVFWELQAVGCEGTASFSREGTPVVCGYLPQSQVAEAQVADLVLDLRSRLQSAGIESPNLRWGLVLPEDWENSWKDYWQTEPIGDRFLVHPDWLPDPDAGDRMIIRLDPGVAFGTGAHATTQLCVEALERQFPTPETAVGQVLADIGCGTSILAIAALKLGVKQVYGVDTDTLAVGAARDCRDLNQISANAMPILHGSVAELRAEGVASVDGICCNILAEVILGLLPEITAIAHSGTWAIFSGILVRQADEISQALKSQGWTVNSVVHKQDWCLIQAQY